MSVSQNFTEFCNNLTITNRSEISSRYRQITRRLNLDFYGYESYTDHSLYVGSYGRNTAIRGFSDLDMLFVLPYKVYTQYNTYSGNGQSALLQTVRNSIKKTYSATNVGADGQVVAVPFSDGMVFEVVPAFTNTNDSYTYPDSNGGGSWKTTDPKPEIGTINNYAYSENLKWLCRMTRAWKGKHNVPMGGLLIDTLAYRFIKDWQHHDKSKIYYDWMSRDFFSFLSKEDPDKSYWYALGSNQLIYRKGKFEYKAKLAYNKAVEAIKAQTNEYWYSAKSTWREIYGSAYPS